jgi:hypothetical protein
MWYSHRVTRRGSDASRRRAVPLSSADDSGVACVHPEFDFGAAGWARSVRCRIRQRVFGRARRSRRPCRRLGGRAIRRGNCRQEPHSTSWHSAGEALCTHTARGRLLVAAIATIFVPLPRRVGPTAKPPFCARESGIHECLV